MTQSPLSRQCPFKTTTHHKPSKTAKGLQSPRHWCLHIYGSSLRLLLRQKNKTDNGRGEGEKQIMSFGTRITIHRELPVL